jgi:thiol-disulfide isomerase/thioredoxin
VQSAIRLILLLAIAGALVRPGFAAAPVEGQPAPQFEVRTLDGRVIDSAKTKGQVVLLHFWATWCPPCREEMPAIEKFYADHRGEGFEAIAISVEEAADEAKVKEYAKSFSYPVALVNAARIQGYGRIWALPLSFVIDRNGVLRKSDWTGERPIDAASLAAQVLPLLHGK